MYSYFDPTYILVVIGAVLSMIASSYVNSTFKKYAKVRGRSGITGAEAAARILQMSGIHDVQIQHISGDLTDHYDPTKKVLRLSDSVYDSRSVAAIGVQNPFHVSTRGKSRLEAGTSDCSFGTGVRTRI